MYAVPAMQVAENRMVSGNKTHARYRHGQIHNKYGLYIKVLRLTCIFKLY